jgi:hypothetical protein
MVFLRKLGMVCSLSQGHFALNSSIISTKREIASVVFLSIPNLFPLKRCKYSARRAETQVGLQFSEPQPIFTEDKSSVKVVVFARKSITSRG